MYDPGGRFFEPIRSTLNGDFHGVKMDFSEKSGKKDDSERFMAREEK